MCSSIILFLRVTFDISPQLRHLFSFPLGIQIDKFDLHSMKVAAVVMWCCQ